MRPTLTEASDSPLAERQLAQVLERVHDCVVLSAGGHATLNAAARQLLALPEDVEFESALFAPRTLTGEPYVLAPDIETGFGATAGRPGGRFRIKITTYDGRELVIDGSVSPVGTGAVIVFRDVTDEHMRSELSDRTLSALFDALPLAIGIVDPETDELLKVNRAFSDLVGLAPEEIAGLRPPFPWWEAHEEPGVFRPGASFQRIFREPNGRPHPVEISVHAVGEEEQPQLLLAVVGDLSEEQRMQQQLIQSGKLAAIGELAAGVAHEINNPLFAILGLTEFLLKEAEPESRAQQRLQLIQETGLEIKEIVRALLDFARENAEERHEVSLADVVRSTCDLVRRTNAHKGVELIDRYDDVDPTVLASPNQLKQIVLNLIANARQAMPNGGTVTVEVRRDGEYGLVTVCDDGPGIPNEIVSRIFEPFFTTKRNTGGTGLGLSVSLGIAEAHGGRLTVDSQVGQGAEFTLCLPIASEARAPA